ncbi:hypothetical protein IMG5_203310 [Ichthyophthirius multifiliis]|uniref:AMP-dependent synthetase/ligase domain-containing protein n=1 Tax=Ichthyophthirius multifiliis TaxID=5932 RepID=G0R6A7_ICHMU|nr:hypothetical protein IMG5_203310 [Ichthyophthirius multifiliis]EGR26991.1 hypothetical protein IMG5_203310 [Ichthyophthirius multifiliis]|eukprot:XP_004023875.1 hypothetical protein IMG5_203310 [Ichthyophthirius multifiliis]
MITFPILAVQHILTGAPNKEKHYIYTKPTTNPKDGETAVFRTQSSFESLKNSPDGICFTMQDIFLEAVKKYKNCPLLGRIEQDKVQWRSYQECKKLAEIIGTHIEQKSLFTVSEEHEGIKMELVGIFSKNREEWLLLEYSNFLYNKTMVPFYDTLGPQSTSYILEQTGLETIFCSEEGVDVLLKTLNTHNLNQVVIIDDISQEKIQQLQELGLVIIRFSDLLTPVDHLEYKQVKTNDIVTFSYTSGTTGTPKGALINHQNFVSVIAIATEENFQNGDVFMSYLPLPHILERISVSTMIYFGAQIAFYSGDIRKIKNDLELIKPTVFSGVPRVYNKFYDIIRSEFEIKKGFLSYILNFALKWKIYNAKRGKYTHFLWDFLIFNKVKKALGGNVKFAIVGGAPISTDVLVYLKAVFSIPILEGYGQTETTGASFSTHLEDGDIGHVGGTRSHMEFKLVDIPEMGYKSSDLDKQGNLAPRGEIFIRGNGVFSGYYKEKEKTDEILDQEGWIKSGDVGCLNIEKGCISIIDRKKNIFKLSQGEYIAPDKIENIYLRADGVEEVFVYGDSLQSTLVAIVVPNIDYLKREGKKRNIEFNIKEMCANQEICQAIFKNMINLGKKEGLHSFEQAKSIHLNHESFQKIECMTNTLKIKRNECKKYFQNVIDQMYNQQQQPQQSQQ